MCIFNTNHVPNHAILIKGIFYYICRILIIHNYIFIVDLVLSLYKLVKVRFDVGARGLFANLLGTNN